MSDKKHFAGTLINGVFFLKELPTTKKKRRGVFVCPLCKNEYETYLCNVTSFKSKSCGCENRNNVTHDMSKTPEYRHWAKMKERCYDPNNNKYSNYGAKGIIVCDRWRYSFKNFFEDMGKRPSSKHTPDRYPNQAGNYEPINCRWATKREQARNRRNTVMATYNGVTKAAAQWCEELRLDYELVRKRLTVNKFSVEDAFFKPSRSPGSKFENV